MNTAIFCKKGCRHALKTISLFQEKKLPLPIVIVETESLSKKTKNQNCFREEHRKFNQNYLNKKKSNSFRNSSFLNWLRYFRWRMKLGAKTFFVKNHSSYKTKKIIERNNISLTFLTSTHRLIKEPLLSIPALKIINIHPAKLPEHRGLDCIAWSVMADSPLGATAHIIDEGIDSGPILFFEEIFPKEGDNLALLKERIMDKKAEMFLKAYNGFKDQSLRLSAQDSSSAVLHSPMTAQQLAEANAKLEKK